MTSTLKIMILGDVVGKTGREACKTLIPQLRESEELDCVIVNVENLAGGSGINAACVDELFRSGVDVMTNGDHAFRKKEGVEIYQTNKKVLRPANYPLRVPGEGSVIVQVSGVKIAVLNLMGRVFMKPLDCPFEKARNEVERLRRETPVIIVDIHAEASAEKAALGWFLDGKVSCVVGTHTHVQTADDKILPKGTAYLTDLGMCGSHHSVIGREPADAIHMFTTQMPVHLRIAEEDPRVSGLIVEVDPESGRALNLRRINEGISEHAHV